MKGGTGRRKSIIQMATGDFVSRPVLKPKLLFLSGPLGSGRQDSMHWLLNQAMTEGHATLDVRLAKADLHVNYRAAAKFFKAFIREENFNDIARQTFVINQLLQELYHGDQETLEKVAYPTLVTAMGVTCPLTAQKKSVKMRINNINKIPPAMVMQCLLDIFTALLAERPVLILFMDVDFMDEHSWRLIENLMEVRARAAFVLSKHHHAVSEGTKADVHIAVDAVELHSALLLRKDNCDEVILANYSHAEVKSFMTHFLSKAGFKFANMPKDLDSIVFKLSGGNPFWVREICAFIALNGVHEFTSTLGIKAETTQQKKPSTNKRISVGFGSIPSTPRRGSKRGGTVVPSAGADEMSISINSMSFHLRDGGEVDGKNNLGALVLSRFARLSVDEQNVARLASVVGMEFTVKSLKYALTLELVGSLTGHLIALVEGNWLACHEGASSTATAVLLYGFVHPVLFDTIYNLTPLSTKQALHLKIAKVS